MALRETLRKHGNWLFRWRSYLPLISIGIIMLGMRDYEYLGHSHRLDQLWELLCLAISFLGLGMRIYTVGHIPKGTSGNTRTQVAEVLNTTGMYSIVRHPLYLGNLFISMGLSMFLHLWWIFLIFMLLFWLYYERIMFAEEEFLREKFGGEFEEWANRTPAFFPRFENWKRPSSPFSFRNVLKREYSGFFGIIVAFTFLEIIGDVFAAGKPELDMMWIILFTIGLVIYLILRVLKKKTKILDVARMRDSTRVG